MTKCFPYLAMDSAGRRTILCDHPVKMFDTTTKKETSKMKTISTSDAKIYGGLFLKNRAVANRFFAKCMGQDAAVDDETAARIKEFLSDKLSDKDHTALCAMLNGEDNVEAEDTEPAPDDVELPKNAIERPLKRSAAADAKADFLRRFPEAARIRIDNSGIQPPARAASYSDAAGAKSFFELFPQAKRIRLA